MIHESTTSAYGIGVRPLNVSTFKSDAHALECVTYSIENFLCLEGGSQSGGDKSLEKLFDYWCQQEGSIPSHFTPYEYIVSSRETITAVIDVRPDNPMDFVLSHHKVCSTTGRSDGWRGMPLGRIDAWGDYLRVRAIQYNLCRHTGLPSFHEIRHDVSGLQSHFVVLLLPVSDTNSGKTERVYSCVRRLSENQFSRGIQ